MELHCSREATEHSSVIERELTIQRGRLIPSLVVRQELETASDLATHSSEVLQGLLVEDPQTLSLVHSPVTTISMATTTRFSDRAPAHQTSLVSRTLFLDFLLDLKTSETITR